MTIPSNSGTLNGINAALDAGVTYDPGYPEPETDMVTLTVADGLGGTDTVNFIFNQAGEGPSVTLQGTDLNDVILATGYSDSSLEGQAPTSSCSRAIGTRRHHRLHARPGQDHLYGDLPFDVGNAASFNAWITNVMRSSNGERHPDSISMPASILLSNVSRANLQMNDFILIPGGGNSA